jgi:hypothetical protein
VRRAVRTSAAILKSWSSRQVRADPRPRSADGWSRTCGCFRHGVLGGRSSTRRNRRNSRTSARLSHDRHRTMPGRGEGGSASTRITAPFQHSRVCRLLSTASRPWRSMPCPWRPSVCCFKTANKGRMLQPDPRGPSEDGKRWRSSVPAGTYEGAQLGTATQKTPGQQESSRGGWPLSRSALILWWPGTFP